MAFTALGKIAVPQPGGSGLYVSIPFPRWQRYEQFVSRVSGVSSNMAGLPLLPAYTELRSVSCLMCLWRILSKNFMMTGVSATRQ